jgi:hypothetical protein
MPTPSSFSLCALGLALGLPSLAHAAPADAGATPGAADPGAAAATTNASIVAAAKASPLFKKEVVRKNLKRQGLTKIVVRPGVEMDLATYVTETGLDKQEQTAPLFDEKLRPQYLTAAPTYKESIVVLEDRLVVDRIMTVKLLPGACDDGAAPKAVHDLCFVENKANKNSKAVTADIKKIRAELAKADPGKIIHGTLTAKQAMDMDDKTLLGALLNTDTRTIHHTSIIPRISNEPTPTPGLGKLDTALVPSAADTGLLQQQSVNDSGVSPADVAQVGGTKEFATRYFLTGFTYGRQIEDAWEYTLAGETWLTDRYYVRLAYHLSFGFGVRAPFSIGVKSSGGGNSRRVDVSVAPIDVDSTGSPAYQAVGLPANKTFEGKEFVLEFKAGCSFYASVPGPNVDKKCPSIDKGYSRDVNPVIGAESSAIHDWWLDGTVTGLSLNFAVVKASIDLGVGADITNGKIRMRATGTNGATVSMGALSFNSRSAIGFDVTSGGQSNPGLRLDDPRYGFDLRLRPKIRGKIDIDVAVYERQFIVGPYPLDFLAIARSFELSHHSGTVANHDYAVFDNGLVVFDPNISDPVPPPKQPPGGKTPKVKKPPVNKPDVFDPNP